VPLSQHVRRGDSPGETPRADDLQGRVLVYPGDFHWIVLNPVPVHDPVEHRFPDRARGNRRARVRSSSCRASFSATPGPPAPPPRTAASGPRQSGPRCRRTGCAHEDHRSPRHRHRRRHPGPGAPARIRPGADAGRASAEGLTSAEGLAGQRRSKIQRYLALVTAVAAAAAGEDHQGRVRERPALALPRPRAISTEIMTKRVLRCDAANAPYFETLTPPVKGSALSRSWCAYTHKSDKTSCGRNPGPGAVRGPRARPGRARPRWAWCRRGKCDRRRPGSPLR
jgi:hypothetical protein